MSEQTKQAASPPPNVGFIADLGIRLVEQQLNTIDKLDSKAGILWGLLGAMSIWLLKEPHSRDLKVDGVVLGWALPEHIPAVLFAAGLIFFVAGFFFALAAVFPRSVPSAANYADVVQHAALTEDALKARMVSTLSAAHQTNQVLIAKKGRHLKRALITTTIGVPLIALGVGIPRFFAG